MSLQFGNCLGPDLAKGGVERWIVENWLTEFVGILRIWQTKHSRLNPLLEYQISIFSFQIMTGLQ